MFQVAILPCEINLRRIPPIILGSMTEDNSKLRQRGPNTPID